MSANASAHTVAPYTGAWIEIRMVADRLDDDEVAPYTGAWIEIRGGKAA